MNAAVVCLVGLGAFGLGYRFYSRYLARRVFVLRDDEPVPARTQKDGVDYVPTDRHVLLGHHYSSIAGAAPIIGPAVAIVWGWVPAFLWVVLGTIFMGAVHDFSTLVLSVRHHGKSVGTIVAYVIGPRTRPLFLLVIFFLLLLVIAVFAKAIAGLFVRYPGSVVPVNFEIIVALLIGHICYKQKRKLFWPSVAALVSLYGMVWVGVHVPVSIKDIFGSSQHLAWIVALLAYSFVASILPVWMLLQPRDYINGHQLIVGLFALVSGLVIAQPTISAPAFSGGPADAPLWFPFLFVTIACGAISGFHGLVSSGTTSKQLACASDARLVGYGGMLGEGTLALVSTLAVSAGLSHWSGHYHSFAEASAQGVSHFVEGASSFLTALFIPQGAAEVVVAVLVISFAATSLDTGVRVQRYILHELGQMYRIRGLQNRYIAGLLAVLFPFALVLAGGAGDLWHLFGGANQLLAGLSLTVVTVWLYRTKRPWIVTGLPMIVVLFVSILAMGIKVSDFAAHQRYLLATLGAMILALEVWVIFEAVSAVRGRKREDVMRG